MGTTFRYLALTALRDRLFISLAIGIGIVGLLSSFLGDKTVVEDQQTIASFAGFGCRLILVAGTVLFVALHVRRAFETREMLLILSRPISRAALMLAYWASFTLLSLPLVLAAAVMVQALSGAQIWGVVAWGLSLWLEVGLMVAAALFFAFGLSGTIAVALLSLAFYLLARSVGVMIAITSYNREDAGRSDLSLGLDGVVGVFGAILPRLDLFARSDWLERAGPSTALFALVVAQAIVYTALMLAAAIHDFQRKVVA